MVMPFLWRYGPFLSLSLQQLRAGGACLKSVHMAERSILFPVSSCFLSVSRGACYRIVMPLLVQCRQVSYWGALAAAQRRETHGPDTATA